MSDRGQTTYDYLLGVVLLLVTIIAVLAVLPSIFDPFVDPVSSEEENLADRVAAEIIETNATAGAQTLNVSGITDDEQYLSDIKRRSGLWETDNSRVNVTFVLGNGTVADSFGDRRRADVPEAQTVRNVRLIDNPACSDACHMIVRVW